MIVDEIENHFHKTLVENMISLYKDKTVNRHKATLIFTTHYCELLDLFNRQDNIYIARADKKVNLVNMYNNYKIRAYESEKRVEEMKYLIMSEGPNKKAIIDILLQDEHYLVEMLK